MCMVLVLALLMSENGVVVMYLHFGLGSRVLYHTTKFN